MIIKKWVLHDWKDESCVKILKATEKQAKEKGGKVIFIENIDSKKHEENESDKAQISMDTDMMVNMELDLQ